MYSLNYAPSQSAFGEVVGKVIEGIGAFEYIKTPQAVELERRGVKTWLTTLMPKSFRGVFAAEHNQFWAIAWRILKKKYFGIPLTKKEQNIFLWLSRGYGKSTVSEGFCIMEGCVVGFGYDLYISDTKQMAEGHLDSIGEILSNGQIEQFYPLMAKPQITEAGKKGTYSAKELNTMGNWGVAARGLKQNVRGGRKGAYRYTIIVADDFDSLNDSPAVTEKKKNILTRTILPAGDLKEMVFLFAQNLITEHSIATQIWEGKTDILQDHIIIGGKPVKAFKEIEIKSFTDEKGRPRNEITSFKTSWEHINIEDAKNLLSRSGKDAFLAEYQHEFKTKKGRLVPNLDRKRHIISWRDFERVFGVPYVPRHWKCKLGADFGYTEKSKTAWAFQTVAAENSPLPGKKFFYRGFVFTEVSPDNQFLQVWKSMFPNPSIGKLHFDTEINFGLYPSLFQKLWLDPRCRPYLEGYEFDNYQKLYRHPKYGFEHHWSSQIVSWQISHEKSGEMMTGRESYRLPLSKIKDFGASSGVSQWVNALEGDYSKPHPFHPDEIDPETGLYKLGCPDYFYIIEPNEILTITGIMQFFDDAENWKHAPQNLTEGGWTEAKPMKMFDTVDAERAIFTTYPVGAAELSDEEKFDAYAANNHPVVAEDKLMELPDEQRGFAVAERAEVRREFEKQEAAVVVPKDLADQLNW